MRRVFHVILAGLIPALLVAVPSGCKDQGKPNPELKVPDIPPSGRDRDKASQKPLPKP